MSSSAEQSLPREPTALRPHSRPTWAPELPRPLTSFVGREREVAEVSSMLARDDVRLLALTGPGGVGKTRLALRVAEELPAFAGGRWFVPLSAISDPLLVIPAIANGIGVPVGQTSSAAAEVRSFLTDRSSLLILDNFEQLLNAAARLANLLEHCRDLKILVTSRVALRITGEHVYSVPALALPRREHNPNLNQLAEIETVKLFLDRAHASAFTFSLNEANAESIVNICHRMDGLPLAIELAATRVGVLGVGALTDRLEQRLAILTGGPNDAPDRQRTMRNTIAWSHDLLGEPERTLFRRLGVFVNGFTLESAEAVAGQGVDVISVLESLVASSLATLAPESADHQRYLMLETIREFALSELVESGEERQVRGNRAHYFMELAERSIPLYDGPSVRAAKDRIEAELDNIRSALSWSLDGGDAETAIRLSGAIWRNWWFGMAVGGQPWKERVAEGRSWLERALVHREGVPITALCEALTGAGHLARLEGDAARSEAYGEELLERSQREYYPYGIYWSFHLLGALAFERQDFDAAHAHFEAALDVAADVRSSANHASMAYCLLGRAAYRQGESVAAEASERLALAFARQSGNPHVLSNALAFLGFLVRRKGALTEAATMLSENLQILVGLRDQVGIRFVLEELSIVAVESRFPERGARFLGAARQLPAPMPGPIPGGRVMGFPFNEGHPVARAFEAVEAPEFDEARRCGQEMGLEDLQREAAALSAILDDSQVERSRSIDEIHGLTPRELDVLRLLVEGGSNRNIADALSLSERTVENHVRHILDKLNLDTRTAAATFAVRHGLA